ncbi:hypothetical protein [Nannocystis punicea]|uniref:Uncharacterized protein n=1 Tax=Nannocystis punicea TaxID=2995304 RepID=A0ABY7HH36_9BACT|nr:hypothetical protein [Nannocystis poenicansa]WAS98402.1 hypothetical protein O0S08_19850 [Nannocystis poenicansa]
MLVASALAAVLLAAPAVRVQDCAPLALHVGPVDAPLAISAFLDPFASTTFGLWLDLRRLVADHEGLVGVRVVPIATTMVENVGDTRILRLLLGAGVRGRQEAALRVLDRDGRDRLAVRLADPAARAVLAGELGLSPEDLALILDDGCIDAAVRAGKAELQRLHQAAGGYLGRPPIFVVGQAAAFEDGVGLERVRGELAREGQRIRGNRPLVRPVMAPRRGVSQRLMRPPVQAGMLVGGVGLPHRLVVFAEHDEHPNFSLLAPVLEFRRHNPGVLAVQVIARGTTTGARQLRVRTCVAEKLGLQLEYLRILAREGEGARREPRSAAAADFIARLDEAPEAQTCELGEPELERGPGGITALPEGVWLDGAAVGQSDLDALAARLAGADAAQRPLDAVFSAAAPEP